MKYGGVRGLLLKLCLAAGVVLGVWSIDGEKSCAQPAAAPTTPCDPQYMDALEARAWLEAQREITQNQNLIYKPDSVLEYTCFDRFLNEAASNFATQRQFSETDHWDGFPVTFSQTTTDNALTEVVLAPLRTYLTSNFLSTGQKGGYLNNRTPAEYTALQTSVAGGTAYACAEMQRVWLLARCMNFIPSAEQNFDGFWDFLHYETTDPRQSERGNANWDLVCTTPDPRFAQARGAAFNNDQSLFQVANIAAPQGDGTPYLEDDIVTHLPQILPGTCNNNFCVPTGICVQRPDLNGGNPYPEMVCSQPGCPAPVGGTAPGVTCP